MEAGRPADAIPLFEDFLTKEDARSGGKPLNDFYRGDMTALAQCYFQAGRPADAVRAAERVRADAEAMYGVGHPKTMGSVCILGQFYEMAGRPADAVATLSIRLQNPNPNPKNWIAQRLAHESRAKAYEALGKYPEAIADWDATVDLTPVGDKPVYRAFRASARIRAGQVEAALKEAEEFATAGGNFPKQNLYNAACVYARAAAIGGEPAERYSKRALELLRGAVAAGERDLDQYVDDEDLAALRGRTDFRVLLAGMAEAGSDQYPRALALIGGKLLSDRRFADAVEVLRECLSVREKSQPDAWTTFNAQSLLGGALLGQKKYADAEPLLRKGYEGMKQREKTIPPVAESASRGPRPPDRAIHRDNKPDEAKVAGRAGEVPLSARGRPATKGEEMSRGGLPWIAGKAAGLSLSWHDGWLRIRALESEPDFEVYSPNGGSIKRSEQKKLSY